MTAMAPASPGDLATIGFIGLGNMGGPMAANLAAAGHRVYGFDLNPASCAMAAVAGVTVSAGVEDAVRHADLVMTMLPAGAAVLDVWRIAVAAARSGALFIDSSTIDVMGARSAHALARDAGFAALDAPVSGGTEGAKAATLTFMVGGTVDAFQAGHPILQRMGRKIIHCGDAGSGQAAKICNNMILGVSMAAVSEAFLLAERLGLSAQSMFDVVSTSSGQCYALTTHCPVPGPVPGSAANRDYKPGFATELMLKDLKLAQEAAGAVGVATPLGELAASLYARFAADGGTGSDYSAIVKFLAAAPREARSPASEARSPASEARSPTRAA
ncbi:MAG: 3-hydroxyisobutyrate dehydrogenase [Rhodospirillales bacterium]|nr:3-hydroxyisobutyrate dehydrogenase [Rhodospirillales bacterium]